MPLIKTLLVFEILKSRLLDNFNEEIYRRPAAAQSWV